MRRLFAFLVANPGKASLLLLGLTALAAWTLPPIPAVLVVLPMILVMVRVDVARGGPHGSLIKPW